MHFASDVPTLSGTRRVCHLAGFDPFSRHLYRIGRPNPNQPSQHSHTRVLGLCINPDSFTNSHTVLCPPPVSTLLTDSHSFPTAKLALRPFKLCFQHRTLPSLHGLDRFGQQFHQLVGRRRHAGPAFMTCSGLRDARVIGRG